MERKQTTNQKSHFEQCFLCHSAKHGMRTAYLYNKKEEAQLEYKKILTYISNLPKQRRGLPLLWQIASSLLTKHLQTGEWGIGWRHLNWKFRTLWKTQWFWWRTTKTITFANKIIMNRNKLGYLLVRAVWQLRGMRWMLAPEKHKWTQN